MHKIQVNPQDKTVGYTYRDFKLLVRNAVAVI